MDLLLKYSQKLISYEFSSGLLFSSLTEKLKTAYPHISFAEQDLLTKLLGNSESYHITIDTKSSPKDPKLIATKPLIDKFTKQDILGLFLTEDEDKKEVITNIYEIIFKNGEAGVNYSDINKNLKKMMNVNLELNMISHYCRKLASCNLVEIISSKTCKNVICKIFTPSVLKKNLTAKKNVEMPEIGEKKEEGGGSFSFHELTFKQNVLANLMSAEANLKNGLSLIELGERIGKPKETKMLNRYLGKIQKTYNIKIKPERQGRLFSYKYLIENEEIKKKLKNLQEEAKQNDDDTKNGTKIENDQAKIHEIVKNELKKQETYVINTQCFMDLVEIFTENQELGETLKKIMETEVFKDFQSLKALKSKEKEAKIIKSLKISNLKENKTKYELLTENMIKILIEKIEFDMVKKALNANANEVSNRSKKQVSSLKINRYIFSLNEIYDHKVLSIQFLKQKIIELEFQAAIGKIDRKTILFMLESIEKVGLIKMIYRDLGAFIKPSIKLEENSSFNNFFKQNKNIILLKGIPENSPFIEEIVQEYKNKKENAKISASKPEKLLEKSKKIRKRTKNPININIEQEYNVKIEKIWEEGPNLRKNSNNNGNLKKSTYRYAKIKDIEVKKTLLCQVLMKNAEKINMKKLKFSWKKLSANMEMLSLQEALKKVALREEHRNNFLTFSMKFDDFNKNSNGSIDLSTKNSIENNNLQGILDEIDENIKNFEGKMEIEENGREIARSFSRSSTENRRKHEKNIEKIKYLLIKYPIRKMKDIETQLNNINYVDLIWKELHRHDMIRFLKVSEEGDLMELEDINFAHREEYYYKVNEKFYEYF